MIFVLKVACAIMIGIGLLVFAWNYKSADDGDEKAKKNKRIGLGLLLAGEALGFSMFLMRVI